MTGNGLRRWRAVMSIPPETLAAQLETTGNEIRRAEARGELEIEDSSFTKRFEDLLAEWRETWKDKRGVV